MQLVLLPLWEHGLKPTKPARQQSLGGLLPLWEHGLKQAYLQIQSFTFKVAPFMGAWIETNDKN